MGRHFPTEQQEGSTMRERHPLEDEVNRLLHNIDQSRANQEEISTPEEETRPLQTEPEATETIHVYMVREREDPLDAYAVDSTLAATTDEPLSSSAAGDPCFFLSAQHQRRTWPGLLTIGAGVMLPLASIAFQVLLALLVPTPTIMLVPLAHHLSTTARILVVSGTPIGAQIPGRLLPSLALTQTKTTPATGKGHQGAQYARGAITFYNGLFTSQTVAAGTILTDSDGVQVVTDQVAVIPAALATSPPTYGRVTVPAQATQTGPQGNISFRDINQACCMPSVLAQNTVAFQDGQNERDYTVVTRADRDNVVSSLTTTLGQSEQAALAAQLDPGEALVTPACKPEVTTDHQPGAEAATVTVTVSVLCTAVAYESAALQDDAVQLLTRQATHMLGLHYSLMGAVEVHVVHAALFDKKRGIATIAVHVEGIWAYQFSQDELEKIKERIAGDTLSQARHTLLSLPGIRRVAVDGMGENQRLPKDMAHFHILLLYGEI
jgi:hypothetical protein